MSLRRVFSFLAIVGLLFVAYGSDRAFSQSVVAPFRYQSQPTVLIPNIDNVMLNFTTLQNFWQMGTLPGGSTPGPCATQISDIVASDTITSPSPSPVPLNCSSPTASPYPYIGAVGMVQDGSTSIRFTNALLGHQGQYLSTASGGSFSTLCNGNAGGNCNKAFSVFCVVSANNIANAAYFFDADGTGSGLSLGASFANGVIVNIRGTQINAFARYASAFPYVYLYAFDGTSKSTLWLNGIETLATTSPLPQSSANSISYFGQQGAAGSAGWNGRIEKCAFFNTALTGEDAYNLYLATGFW